MAQIQMSAAKPQNEKVVVWLQPENKKESCKIYMASVVGQNADWAGSKIAWDGQCKAGYAYGVGREFVESRHGLVATLASYSGGERKPIYEAETNFDAGQIVVGDLEARKVMTINIQHKPLPFSMVSTIFNASGAYDYAKMDALGGPTTSYVKSYGNRYVFRLNQVTDPGLPLEFSMEVLKDGRPLGYRIEKHRNGTMYGISLLGQQPQQVGLPASLVSFYNAQTQEIFQKITEVKPAYDQAMVTMQRYKREICSRTDKVGFVDPEKYRLICTEDGDLHPYKEQIAQVLSDQKDRYTQQAAAAAAEADRQVRMAQANAEIQNNSIRAMTQSANDFSRSMNSYSQGMMDTVRQNNEQLMYQSGQGFQAQPTTYDTNCVNVANIINCKTR